MLFTFLPNWFYLHKNSFFLNFTHITWGCFAFSKKVFQSVALKNSGGRRGVINSVSQYVQVFICTRIDWGSTTNISTINIRHRNFIGERINSTNIFQSINQVFYNPNSKYLNIKDAAANTNSFKHEFQAICNFTSISLPFLIICTDCLHQQLTEFTPRIMSVKNNRHFFAINT